MKTAYGIFVFLFINIYGVFSQVIITDPEFPLEDKSVTIYFDASEGNQALADYSGDVYAHTGVITDKSSGESDWRYVKTEWNENTSENKLIRLSNNKYILSISPSIRDYYGVPEDEKILKMAFVFRNSDGSVVARDIGDSDIFAPVYENELTVVINSPSDMHVYEKNENVLINISAFLSDSVELYVDASLISTSQTSGIEYTFSTDIEGKHKILAIAYSNNTLIKDSSFFYIKEDQLIQELPANVVDGINYIDDNTVTLVLYAPGKNNVFAIGDFNNWDFSKTENTSFLMKRTPDEERFWIELEGLEIQKEYVFQYLVDGEIRIGDPYADKTSDPWNDHYIASTTYSDLIEYPEGKTSDIATVFQTGQSNYVWQNTDYELPSKENLVIYELLIRDFTALHSYKSLTDTIAYFKRLGINAIELMPVMEFEGNDSWGYNPSYFFAPDKYYGNKNSLKSFIDTCHANNIAVIFDIALNHAFGQCPLVKLYFDPSAGTWGQPTAENPWFNEVAKHDFNVGYDFNHESEATKSFASRVIKYWLEEYHIDGYRFDLSKGFTQVNTLGNTAAWGHYDASRVNILKSYADTVWSVNPEAYVILEHFADNDEEKVLSEMGMMLWGNLNHRYNEATMGYLTNSNFSGISYLNRDWSDPHLIGYMESHDEERLMYRNLTYGNSLGDYDITVLNTALKRIELAANFFFTVPGPKMLWQFGELGYDISIDYNGRTGKKPIKWEYFNELERQRLFQVYRALIKLKTDYPAFQSTDFEMSIGSYKVKRINIYHESMDVVVLGNFGLSEQSGEPNFSQTGWWYEYYTGDSLEVSDVNTEISLKPGEYRLYTTKRLKVPDIVSSVFNIQEKAEDVLAVYPNPARDKIVVESLNKMQYINIYDSTGRLIMSKNAQNVNQFHIDLSNLPGGLYLIKGLMVNKQTLQVKFIKTL